MTKRTGVGAYEVGYARPPRTTQFRKGQSGNPNGRPKGGKNFETRVRAAFDRRITIREHGRERRVTVAEAILTKLTAEALGSQANAMAAIRLAVGLLQSTTPEARPGDVFSTEADRALLLAYFEEQAPKPPEVEA